MNQKKNNVAVNALIITVVAFVLQLIIGWIGNKIFNMIFIKPFRMGQIDIMTFILLSSLFGMFYTIIAFGTAVMGYFKWIKKVKLSMGATIGIIFGVAMVRAVGSFIQSQLTMRSLYNYSVSVAMILVNIMGYIFILFIFLAGAFAISAIQKPKNVTPQGIPFGDIKSKK